jgi:uncharacterized protein YutE (UPF0331/DUF86 family)
MNTAETREETLLESVLPRYIADGFTVVRHPSPAVLPSFMGNYRPDAIALRPNKKIAIEVKRDLLSTQTYFRAISQLFDQHPDWELRVYYLPEFSQERNLKPPSEGAIEGATEEIANLKAAGHFAAATMMAWATLEAIGRALLPEKLTRPQPTGQLVEVLASEGLVTPSEADVLRRGVELRNAVAHGNLGIIVTEESVDELITAVRVLADLLSQAQTSRNDPGNG